MLRSYVGPRIIKQRYKKTRKKSVALATVRLLRNEAVNVYLSAYLFSYNIMIYEFSMIFILR